MTTEPASPAAAAGDSSSAAASTTPSRGGASAPRFGWFRVGLWVTAICTVGGIVVSLLPFLAAVLSGLDAVSDARRLVSPFLVAAALLATAAGFTAWWTLPSDAPPRRIARWIWIPLVLWLGGLIWTAVATGQHSGWGRPEIPAVATFAATFGGWALTLMLALTVRAAGRWLDHPATTGLGTLAVIGSGISIVWSIAAASGSQQSSGVLGISNAPSDFMAFLELLAVPTMLLSVIGLAGGSLAAVRATRGTPLAVGQSPRSGSWKWAAGGAVSAVVLTAFVGWLWLADVPYDEEFYEGIRQSFMADVHPDQNAITVYREVDDTDFPVIDEQLRESIVDSLLSTGGQQVPDLAPVKRLLAGAGEAVKRQDRAMQMPVARGNIDLATITVETEIPISQWVIDLTKIRLLATVDTPDEFIRALAAVRHACTTFCDHSSLVDAAISCVMMEFVMEAVAAHLTLCRGTITADQYAALDAELAAFEVCGRSGLDSLVGEFYTTNHNSPSWGENKVVEWVMASTRSRRARAGEAMIRDLMAANEVPNHEWTHLASRPSDFHIQSLSTWEKLRMGPIAMIISSVAIPIYQGIVAKIRCIRTHARLGRLAIRIEQYRAANDGQLPLALTDLPDAGDLIRDDWTADGHYCYSRVASPAGNDEGFWLGAKGNHKWSDWPQRMQDGDFTEPALLIPPR